MDFYEKMSHKSHKSLLSHLLEAPLKLPSSDSWHEEKELTFIFIKLIVSSCKLVCGFI